MNRSTCELCLHAIHPKAGDCIFIPAGTVHSLGAGLLIAEIQQSSDTTFRLYDWNRRDECGQSRTLHIEQAMSVIDFARGPVEPQTPLKTDRKFAKRLVECEKFVLDRLEFSDVQTLGGDGRCHIVSVLHGSAEVCGDRAGEPLKVGQTIVIPAAAEDCAFTPVKPVTLLDMYLP